MQPWHVPVDLPGIESVESDLMNAPFSLQKFPAALASCGLHTALDVDGVEYYVVRGLSSLSHEFLLTLFNRMFRDSLFPESWRSLLVVFIPKTGTGKFRPVSHPLAWQSISIPKCQRCVFIRARRCMGDVSIRAGDSLISCQPTLKYLGVTLDSRLT